MVKSAILIRKSRVLVLCFVMMLYLFCSGICIHCLALYIETKSEVIYDCTCVMCMVMAKFFIGVIQLSHLKENWIW